MGDDALIKRLSFIAEWFQQEAGIVRTYHINFYTTDNAIEVFDLHSKKTFLRRTKMKELEAKDLFVGAKISIFGRQFDIVDYGDEYTRNTLAKYRKRSFFLILPSILKYLGKITECLIDSDFSITKGHKVKFSQDNAKEFLYSGKVADVESGVIMNQLVASETIGFELISENAVEKLRQCKLQSQESFGSSIPQGLRALFEDEEIRNGVFCSKSDEDAHREIEFFFNSKNRPPFTHILNNTTLGIIKPHAIKEGKIGKIISEILRNKFQITAMRMIILERINCEEFLEVYRGIAPEYIQMVAQLSSGVCMALEIACEDPNKSSYEEFRNFCGPNEPEIAKLLRPHTLRAKFGTSKVLNAIHCTDLKEDTMLEIQYIFQIID